MRKKTKERKEIEKSLLYYLQLYNEIKGRNEAWQILSWLEDSIDELVEKLKIM